MADAAEQLAVARYLQVHSHDNILLRWVSKEAGQPAGLGPPARDRQSARRARAAA
jgi:hypothetical protein